MKHSAEGTVRKNRLPWNGARVAAGVFAALSICAVTVIFAVAGSRTVRAANTPTTETAAAKPDADASKAAWEQVYRVLVSPRCQNCHPAGDRPLQGDDSHVHQQNIKRGDDGHGV